MMVRGAVRFTILLLAVALLEIACSRPAEQQLLNQFFRAARNRDNTTAAMMSSVTVDPRTQGSIEGFSITSVGPEQRAPLPYKALMQTAEQARQAEAEFQRQKKAYSDANLKTIEEVLKLENNPAAKLTPQQAAVKTEWDKWRADTATFVKNMTRSAGVCACRRFRQEMRLYERAKDGTGYRRVDPPQVLDLALRQLQAGNFEKLRADQEEELAEC
jgi:hypothetical protein